MNFWIDTRTSIYQPLWTGSIAHVHSIVKEFFLIFAKRKMVQYSQDKLPKQRACFWAHFQENYIQQSNKLNGSMLKSVHIKMLINKVNSIDQVHESGAKLYWSVFDSWLFYNSQFQ